MIVRRLMILALIGVMAPGAAAAPATQPAGGIPFVEIDLPARQVRVQCQAIMIDAPLEFFCVAINGPEHESVLRTPAKPSDIHLALLAIGLEPGQPARFSGAANKWLPPDGPPVRVSVRFERDGREIALPASRLVRDIRTRAPMPERPFVFTGSRVLDDGRYAADVTGYVVSLVNFDLTPIDVPHVASNANELLELEINPDIAPPMGTAVTMILEPVAGGATADREEPTTRLSDVTTDPEKIDRLQALWTAKVAPHDAALREASAAQYQVIRELRREQQRLIDEADRIQRLIDDLERKYQDMTTPKPD